MMNPDCTNTVIKRRMVLFSDVRESIERGRDPGARPRVSRGGIGEHTCGRLSAIRPETTLRERAAKVLRQEALQCSTDNL